MSVNAGEKYSKCMTAIQGNRFWLELARGLSHRGFKLSKLSGVDYSVFLFTLNETYIKIFWL